MLVQTNFTCCKKHSYTFNWLNSFKHSLITEILLLMVYEYEDDKDNDFICDDGDNDGDNIV